MKICKHICDLCGGDLTRSGDIKYKYRAVKHWYAFPQDEGWERIELCSGCAGKLISIRPDKETRSKGEWIRLKTECGMIVPICSKCGFDADQRKLHRYNYCPNCGADMRGKADEV